MRPVVVTDMHEPLIVTQRRIMRFRMVFFGIWLVGWVVSGVLYQHGILATAILMGSGPGLWLVVWALRSLRKPPGHRVAVTRRQRALGAGGPASGAGP